jgi:hypothetical protein
LGSRDLRSSSPGRNRAQVGSFRLAIMALAKRRFVPKYPTVNKCPRTKHEIQDMVTAELRRFAGCEEAWGVVVVGLDAEISGATWTVPYACDRALQVIVPHYQRLYDLKQKH